MSTNLMVRVCESKSLHRHTTFPHECRNNTDSSLVIIKEQREKISINPFVPSVLNIVRLTKILILI